jgi:hypothetical protein
MAPTRGTFALIGAWLLLGVFRLAQLLGGGATAPELGDAELALAIARTLAGVAFVLVAAIALRRPAVARVLGFIAAALFTIASAVDAAYVWGWDPGDDPSLMGARMGELLALAFMMAVGLLLALLSVRVLARWPGPVHDQEDAAS